MIPGPGPRRDLLLAVVLFAASAAEIVLRDLELEGLLLGSAALMTLPLALRNRSPWIPYGFTAVAFGVLAASGTEPELTAQIVALWALAFTFGALPRLREAVIGLVAVALPVSLPLLVEDPGELIWIVGVFVFPPWFIGRLMGGRRERLRELQRLRADLEAERERVARLAAEVERARLAEDIETVLARSLRDVAERAAAAREAGDPDVAAAAFAAIRESGTEALAELRRLLGVLRGPGGATPARPS